MSWPTKAARRFTFAALLLAQEEGEFLLGRGLREELVAGLLREGLEILHRAGVGGDDAQHLAGGHLVQRLAGAQDRQRAIHSARVQLLVVGGGGHGRLLVAEY